MVDTSIGTPEQLRDPNYMPALHKAIPLGIQHVLAMFVSNVTPAIIVAGAAGFGFGSNSPDFPELLYLIQMSMLFAGIATLLQTITVGPVGAALPIVQGTSFAFLPIMIPLVVGKGVDALAVVFGGVIIGGIFHAILGTFIGKIRFALPPLVTGLVVSLIGSLWSRSASSTRSGGVFRRLTSRNMAACSTGRRPCWSSSSPSGLKFYRPRHAGPFRRCLLGILAGYVYALHGWHPVLSHAVAGQLEQRGGLCPAAAVQIRFRVLHCSGHRLLPDGLRLRRRDGRRRVRHHQGRRRPRGNRPRDPAVPPTPTDSEPPSPACSAAFPNTSFSQNVGLIAMTGVMSRQCRHHAERFS